MSAGSILPYRPTRHSYGLAFHAKMVSWFRLPLPALRHTVVRETRVATRLFGRRSHGWSSWWAPTGPQMGSRDQSGRTLFRRLSRRSRKGIEMALAVVPAVQFVPFRSRFVWKEVIPGHTSFFKLDPNTPSAPRLRVIPLPSACPQIGTTGVPVDVLRNKGPEQRARTRVPRPSPAAQAMPNAFAMAASFAF